MQGTSPGDGEARYREMMALCLREGALTLENMALLDIPVPGEDGRTLRDALKEIAAAQDVLGALEEFAARVRRYYLVPGPAGLGHSWIDRETGSGPG